MAAKRGRPPKTKPNTSSSITPVKAKADVRAKPSTPSSNSTAATTSQPIVKPPRYTYRPFKDAPYFPFDDIDTYFPSSSPSSSKTIKKNQTSLSKSSSNSTLEASSSQIPAVSPRPKKRGRRSSKKGKERSSDISSSDLSELLETEASSPTPKSKRTRKNHVTHSTHADLSPSPSYSRSISPYLDLRDDTGDYVEHTHEELMALYESSPIAALSSKEEEEVFIPSKMPHDLEIGQSVFVQWQTCWWPARILSFDPATNLKDQKKGKDYFTVETSLGNIQKRRRRDQIITVNDDSIATCVLGQTITEKRTFTSDADIRAPTPEPTILTTEPLPPEEFNNLDRIVQLYLIRPHLQSIISEEYAPAQWRLDKFFAGGKERLSLGHEAAFGDIHEDEVEGVFIPELRRWLLRADGRNDKRIRPGEPSRPTGSERYNVLPHSQLKDYIQDVLLPETIIQLCIRSVSAEFLFPTDKVEEEDGDELVFEGLDDDDDDDNDSAHSPEYTPTSTAAPLMCQLPPQIDTTVEAIEDVDPAVTLYQTARSHLLKLRRWNLEADFDGRCATLRNARRMMRKQQGLLDEGLDDIDIEKEKMNTGEYYQGWAGRIRKKVNMKE